MTEETEDRGSEGADGGPERLVRGADAMGMDVQDTERMDRDQKEQALAESEERTEDNSTVDPHDPNIIRRRSEDTAE